MITTSPRRLALPLLAAAAALPLAFSTDEAFAAKRCGGFISNGGVTATGVTAYGPTTCPFARNVANGVVNALDNGAGEYDRFSIVAYSPALGRSLRMTCGFRAYDSLRLTCRGGNHARVDVRVI